MDNALKQQVTDGFCHLRDNMPGFIPGKAQTAMIKEVSQTLAEENGEIIGYPGQLIDLSFWVLTS